MRVYTEDLQIVKINKDLIERENKGKFWARNSPLIRSWLFPESLTKFNSLTINAVFHLGHWRQFRYFINLTSPTRGDEENRTR